jgi:hypothetical protein
MKKNPYFHQDRQAMRIADRYGMTHAYKVSRRNNLSPIEALAEWDIYETTDLTDCTN